MANVVTDRVQTDQHVEAQTILKRSVVLVLRCSYLGNHRKAQLETAVEAAVGHATDVDDRVAKQINITKRLVDSRAVRNANAVPQAAKAYLRTVAIPAHRVFGERAYLVPIEKVVEVDDRLTQFAAQALMEGQRVAEQWDRLVADQQEKIGPLFNAKDYLTSEQVAREWSIEWDYVSFAAPERLEHVDRALFENARARYERRMSDAYSEVRAVLRETLLQLVVEIKAKLTPGEDGKPKVFRNTILDGLTEFLGTFQLRNIADDAELAQVVERLHGLTSGLDADTIRTTDGVRASVLAGVTEAVAVLDSLVQTGARAIALDGEL